jgi:hypothetical protein
MEATGQRWSPAVSIIPGSFDLPLEAEDGRCKEAFPNERMHELRTVGGDKGRRKGSRRSEKHSERS